MRIQSRHLGELLLLEPAFGIVTLAFSVTVNSLLPGAILCLESGEEAEIIQESSIDSIIEPGTKIKLTINTDKVNIFTADGSANMLTGVRNDCAAQ